MITDKCVRVRNVTSPEQVEAMAGRAAVALARDGGLSPVIFETDSLLLNYQCSSTIVLS